MILFLSMIIASLAVHFVDGWIGNAIDDSIRIMLDLIIFIATYMFSKRYLKNFRD